MDGLSARLAMLASAVLFGACGSSTSDPASDASATDRVEQSTPSSATVEFDEITYVGPLTFDWPLGACEVPVTESVLKDGNQATLEYRLSLSPDPAGIEVSYVDMSVVEVNGEAVPSEAAEELNAVFAQIPSFLVASDGIAVGLTGFDDMLESVDELSPGASTDLTPEAIAALEEVVLTKYWDTWAGFWAGLGEVTDETSEQVVSLPFGDIVIDVALSVENLRSTSTGNVELRSTQTIAGPDLARAMGVSVEMFGGDVADFESQTIDAGRITVTEVVTDPKTLRPVTASFENATDMTINGQSFNDEEIRTWTFNWETSDCPPS